MEGGNPMVGRIRVKPLDMLQQQQPEVTTEELLSNDIDVFFDPDKGAPGSREQPTSDQQRAKGGANKKGGKRSILRKTIEKGLPKKKQFVSDIRSKFNSIQHDLSERRPPPSYYETSQANYVGRDPAETYVSYDGPNQNLLIDQIVDDSFGSSQSGQQGDNLISIDVYNPANEAFDNQSECNRDEGLSIRIQNCHSLAQSNNGSGNDSVIVNTYQNNASSENVFVNTYQNNPNLEKNVTVQSRAGNYNTNSNLDSAATNIVFRGGGTAVLVNSQSAHVQMPHSGGSTFIVHNSGAVSSPVKTSVQPNYTAIDKGDNIPRYRMVSHDNMMTTIGNGNYRVVAHEGINKEDNVPRYRVVAHEGMNKEDNTPRYRVVAHEGFNKEDNAPRYRVVAHEGINKEDNAPRYRVVPHEITSKEDDMSRYRVVGHEGNNNEGNMSRYIVLPPEIISKDDNVSRYRVVPHENLVKIGASSEDNLARYRVLASDYLKQAAAGKLGNNSSGKALPQDSVIKTVTKQGNMTNVVVLPNDKVTKTASGKPDINLTSLLANTSLLKPVTKKKVKNTPVSVPANANVMKSGVETHSRPGILVQDNTMMAANSVLHAGSAPPSNLPPNNLQSQTSSQTVPVKMPEKPKKKRKRSSQANPTPTVSQATSVSQANAALDLTTPSQLSCNSKPKTPDASKESPPSRYEKSTYYLYNYEKRRDMLANCKKYGSNAESTTTGLTSRQSGASTEHNYPKVPFKDCRKNGSKITKIYTHGVWLRQCYVRLNRINIDELQKVSQVVNSTPTNIEWKDKEEGTELLKGTNAKKKSLGVNVAELTNSSRKEKQLSTKGSAEKKKNTAASVSNSDSRIGKDHEVQLQNETTDKKSSRDKVQLQREGTDMKLSRDGVQLQKEMADKKLSRDGVQHQKERTDKKSSRDDVQVQKERTDKKSSRDDVQVQKERTDKKSSRDDVQVQKERTDKKSSRLNEKEQAVQNETEAKNNSAGNNASPSSSRLEQNKKDKRKSYNEASAKEYAPFDSHAVLSFMEDFRKQTTYPCSKCDRDMPSSQFWVNAMTQELLCQICIVKSYSTTTRVDVHREDLIEALLAASNSLISDCNEKRKEKRELRLLRTSDTEVGRPKATRRLRERNAEDERPKPKRIRRIDSESDSSN